MQSHQEKKGISESKEPSAKKCVITCLIPIPNGNIVVGYSNGKIEIQEPKHKKHIATLQEALDPEREILSLALMENDLLISSDTKRTFQIWDLKEQKCIKTRRYQDHAQLLDVFSKNCLISADIEGSTIRIMNTRSQQVWINQEIELKPNITALLTLENNILISGHRGGKICIWEMITADMVHQKFELKLLSECQAELSGPIATLTEFPMHHFTATNYRGDTLIWSIDDLSKPVYRGVLNLELDKQSDTIPRALAMLPGNNFVFCTHHDIYTKKLEDILPESILLKKHVFPDIGHIPYGVDEIILDYWLEPYNLNPICKFFPPAPKKQEEDLEPENSPTFYKSLEKKWL